MRESKQFWETDSQECVFRRGKISDSFKCTDTITAKHIMFIMSLRRMHFSVIHFWILVRAICIWQDDLLILSNRSLLWPHRKIEGEKKKQSGVGCAVHQLLSFLSLEVHKQGSVLHLPSAISTCSHRA